MNVVSVIEEKVVSIEELERTTNAHLLTVVRQIIIPVFFAGWEISRTTARLS